MKDMKKCRTRINTEVKAQSQKSCDMMRRIVILVRTRQNSC